MRIVPPETYNPTGLIPLNIVRVFWAYGLGNVDVNNRLYDASFLEYDDSSAVVSIGSISNGIAINSTSSQVDITLIDKDGKLKAIFDRSDIHMRKVQIFQFFAGYPEEHKFMIFEGLINTPIDWDEAAQTLSFVAINRIEDVEVGFSIDEGNFPYVPQNLFGKAWPQVFGTAFGVPTLQINKVPQSVISTFTALVGDNKLAGQKQNFNSSLDSINTQLANLRRQLQELNDLAFQMGVAAGQAAIAGDFATADQFYDKRQQYLDKADDVYNAIARGAGFQNKIARASNTVTTNQTNLKAYEKGSIPIVNGLAYPQETAITALINGYQHSGVIRGGVFFVTGREDLILQNGYGMDPTTVASYGVGNEYTTTIRKGNFQFIPGGSTFSITSLIVRYVVSLGACNVLSLEADRTVSGVTARYVIPPNRYVINVENFGGLLVTMATFPRPLSTYKDEGWSDEVKSNVQSSVGPNIVDVLIYLILRYTSFTYDLTSFNFVKGLNAVFPCGFALLDKKNVLTLMNEICYQSGCVMYLRNNVFFIKYLPYDYPAQSSFTKDHVWGVKVGTTSTEDIVTTYEANWKAKVDQSERYAVIYRNNQRKYGLHKAEDEFYIYNNLDIIQHKALFWCIRRSNMWKRITFTSPLTKLEVEVFDFVGLDFGVPWVSDGIVVGMVESANYNSDTNSIDFSILVPIRIGEMQKYPYATPQAITYLFESDDAGSAVNGNVAGSVLNPNNAFGSNANNYATRPNPDRGRIKPGDGGFSARPNVEVYTSLNEGNITAGTDPLPTETYKQFSVNNIDLSIDTSIAPIAEKTYLGFIVEKLHTNVYLVDGVGSNPKGIAVTIDGVDVDETISPGIPVVVCKTAKQVTVSTGATTTIAEYNGYVATFDNEDPVP